MLKKGQMNREHIVGLVAIVLLFAVYPLIMTNGYFNITFTKYITFIVITLILFGLVMWQKRKFFLSDKFFLKPDATSKFMLAFLLAQIVAFIFSKNKAISFTGSTDRNMGFVAMCMFVLFFFVVREIEVDKIALMYIGLSVFDIIVVISVLQFFKVDCFGLLRYVTSYRAKNFLSTWGNTGLFGIYAVMVATMALGFYLLAKNRHEKFFCGVSCFLVYVAMLISNTDATYLGMGIATILIFAFLVKNRQQFQRFMEVLLLYGYAGSLFHFCYENIIDKRPIATLGKIAMSYEVTISLLVLAVFCWCVSRWGIRDRDVVYEKISKTVRIGMLVAFIVIPILVIWFSCVDKTRELGFLGKYFRFDTDWGTGRGYVWTWSAQMFRNFTWQEKITGAGQGMVAVLLEQNYLDVMRKELGYYFDNAHNVYLHYLLNLGILGVVSYLGVLFSKIFSGLYKKNQGNDNIYLIVIICCGIIDFFSISQPITMPLLFFFLALNDKKGKKW